MISAPLVAGVGGVDLVCVMPEKFREVIKRSARGFHLAFLTEYAKRFVERFNEACLDHACEDHLFNNQKMIDGIIWSVVQDRCQRNSIF